MGEFIYFFPDSRQRVLTKEAWQALCKTQGLSHLSRTTPSCRECLSGPAGAPGLLVTANVHGATSIPRYAKDEQLWRKCSDTLWIGVQRDAMPTPGDLEQPMLIEGHPVELADGNVWRMPRAVIAPGGQTGLEIVLTVNQDTGEDEEAVKPCYRRFGDLARKFWEAFLNAEDGKVTFAMDDLLALSVEGLSHNYRVGMHELRMLGVLSSENVWRLCYAAIDGPRWETMAQDYVEAQKKTDAQEGLTG